MIPLDAPPVTPHVRVGAVSYLNTKPLVEGLETAPGLRLSFDLPSRLADDLSAGHLDVALIPSIEFFQNPDYVAVSDACIGCRGPVLSVKLLSRVPPESIRTLALDEGSRTSAALVQILLHHQCGVRPTLAPLPLGADVVAAPGDAVLLIGDRAIHPPADEFPYRWDLGQQWCEWTGLPFVFAMWTAPSGQDLGSLPAALRDARDRGLARLPEIAAAEASAAGLTPERCLKYLRDNLYFRLDSLQQRGLARFHQLAADLGLAPRDVRLDAPVGS